VRKPIPSFCIFEPERFREGQIITFEGFDAVPMFTSERAAQRFIEALRERDSLKEIKLVEEELRTWANCDNVSVVLDPSGDNDAIYWLADSAVLLCAIEEGATDAKYQKRVCREE